MCALDDKSKAELIARAWIAAAAALSGQTGRGMEDLKDTTSVSFRPTGGLNTQLRKIKADSRWSINHIATLALAGCRPVLELTLTDSVRRASQALDLPASEVFERQEKSINQNISIALAILLSSCRYGKRQAESVHRIHLRLPRSLARLLHQVAANYEITISDTVEILLRMCFTPDDGDHFQSLHQN